MPPFAPIKRNRLIRLLKKAGFDGPYSGSKHQFMVKDEITVRVPDPHKSDIGRSLLAKILKQANISMGEWENL